MTGGTGEDHAQTHPWWQLPSTLANVQQLYTAAAVDGRERVGQFAPPSRSANRVIPDAGRLVVLDAGALIKLQRVDQLGDVFYAPPAILSEVKDARARGNMSMLPVDIKPRDPHPKAIAFVRQFAKQTGDLGFLSPADIDVLALTYTLAKERGVEGLRTEPEPISRAAEPVHDSAFGWAPADCGDGDDGEGGWITADNIGRIAQQASAPEPAIRVACATADYSVQNVLIQIGLPVLSFDGFRVRTVKMWAKICRGCQTFTRDSEKLFCPKCGNATLDRVSYSLEDGKPVIHDNRRFAPKLKGTVFSLPKPKGGRAQDLLLCEDQLLMGDRARQLRHAQKVFEKERIASDPFRQDGLYEYGARKTSRHGAPHAVVGVGRQNPNRPGFKWNSRK
jgi:RNA-binding protein NOB1